jgi:hypothetical protein
VGKGAVTIQLGVDDLSAVPSASAARTLLPAAPLIFDSYDLVFTPQVDGEPVPKEIKDITTLIGIDLDAGTYTLVLKAYKGTEEAAGGTVSGIEVTEGNNTQAIVPLLFKATETGTGTLSVTVRNTSGLPLSQAKFNWKPLSGGTGADSESILSDLGGSKSLKAGYYLVTVTLSSGDRTAKRGDAVHIGAGQTTPLAWEFTEADFSTDVTEMWLLGKDGEDWETPDNAKELMQADDGTFFWEGLLTTGSFRFNLENKTKPNRFQPVEDGTGINDDTPVLMSFVLGDTGSETAWNLGEAGYYRFVVNPLAKTVTVSKPAAVTGVTITGGNITLNKGASRSFTVEVSAYNGAGQEVEWSIVGNNAAGTAFGTGDDANKLTIDSAETAPILTVRAASTTDTAKYDEITVTVQEAEIPAAKYSITLTQTAHGSFTVTTTNGMAVTEAAAGTVVNLSAIPSDGYRFKQWTVTGAAPADITANPATFEMPEGAVTVTAVFDLDAPDTPGDPKFHIYIGFGQSNFEGDNQQGFSKTAYDWTNPRFQVFNAFETANTWDTGAQPYGRRKETWYTAKPPLVTDSRGLTPADGFGRYLVERLADENIKIGVIPIGISGASLDAWEPDTGGNDWIKDLVASGQAQSHWQAPLFIRYDSDGNIYKRMVELARLAQKDGVIKGIIIHQGEGGGGNSYGGWDKLLKRIYDRLLEDLGLEPNSIPLLAGQSKNGWTGNSYWIKNLETDYPGIFHVIEATDLPTGDGIHFTSESMMTLGRRYGEKMLELLYAGYTLNPNITVTQPAAGGSFTVKAGTGVPVPENISAKAGTEIVLEAEAQTGYVFSSFEITGAVLETDYTTANIRRFIMPAGAQVTVTAIFVQEGYNRINVKCAPQFRGTFALNPNPEMAPQGRQITITAAPAGENFIPVVKVQGANSADITGTVLTGNPNGPWVLTMPNEEITITAIFVNPVQDTGALESQNVLYGGGNSAFRNDAATSNFSVTKNQEYEFEIQYKTNGTANRPIAITMIPGDENWPAGTSGFSSAAPYTGSRGRVETYKGTTMVILDNTNGEWVTERFTFKTSGDFTTKGAAGDYNLAGVYIGINPDNTAGVEGWVNYVCLRRMTGDNPPSRNVLGNARFKSGLQHWKNHDSDTNIQIVTMNAPGVPAYAIWADRD